MRTTLILLLACLLSPMMLSAETQGDTIEKTVYGKISSKAGTVVKMQLTKEADQLIVGTTGELSKSFNTEFLGASVSGWMAIGKMKVTAVAKDMITFTLLEELSVVTENGVKKNHFEPGKEVKFVWKITVTPDEAAYQRGQDLVSDDLAAAMKEYMEAIRINPSHDAALNMIGMIWNANGELDSAQYYFLAASKVKTDEVRYTRNVLITAYKLRDYATAYSYADKSVKLSPEDAELNYFRALTLYALKLEDISETDQKAILTDVGKAIELDPANSKYYSERAFFRYTFKDAAGACTDARKAKELGQADMDEDIKLYCEP